VTQADINRARSEIERLKQDIQLKEAELRVLELQMARQAALPAPVAKPKSKTAAEPKTSPSMPMAAALPAPTPNPAPALKRANVDPTPYEASIIGRIQAFRTTTTSKWLVLDEQRLIYWVLDDEAYLLNLTENCPGLLTAERMKLESFSNKVRAGEDGVVFANQRCLIQSIEKLGGHKLPKPPRK
ncbi:MAG: DUF6491 family protein, partial [Arenimonas sp.]